MTTNTSRPASGPPAIQTGCALTDADGDLIADWIDALSCRGVRLWVDAGKVLFEAPRDELSAHELHALRQRKTELLNALTRRLESHTAPMVLARRSSSDPVPLAFQQQWCWNLLKKYPAINAIEPYALRLKGSLNVQCLQESLGKVVRRHESLRTRIALVNDVPMQIIAPAGEWTLPVIDYSGQGQLDGEQSARVFAENLFSKFMDLAAGPLIEAYLIKLADDEHVFVLAVHHIIIDWESEIRLFGELWTLYGNLVRGHQASLPDVSIQYPDYALWQRRSHRAWCQKHAGYWERKLSNITRLKLTPDMQLPDAVRATGQLPIAFGEPLTAAICDFTRRERTTIGMFILALYAATLFRWSSQKTFLIPFLTTGRHLPAHENMIGFLAHVLMLRIDLSGNESIRELIQLVTREFFSTLEHQDFFQIADERPELLDSAVLSIIPWSANHSRGASFPSDWSEAGVKLHVEPFDFTLSLPDEGTCEIALQIVADQTAMQGTVYYRADLFSPSTMQRFSDELKALAAQAVQTLHERITLLVPPAESQRVTQ